MTGYDVFKKAAMLLGYTGTEADTAYDGRLYTAAPTLIERIASDLGVGFSGALSDPLVLSPVLADAMIYGTAMLIAAMEGDGRMHTLFTDLYNAKRATSLSDTGRIEDSLFGGAAG